jgi:predicted dehydrogenase
VEPNRLASRVTCGESQLNHRHMRSTNAAGPLANFKNTVLGLGLYCAATAWAADEPIQLITLDPGHFHAALFQKEMLPGVASHVLVYAPAGPDLSAHLQRIDQFNSRTQNPTHWQLEVHTNSDFMQRMLAEHPGNVVVLSGNNRGKAERIKTLVRAGYHVLADKPWVIESEELPALEEALNLADEKNLAAYDAMTQRFEITCILARELVQDTGIFGQCLSGSPDEPGVRMESVHYFMKEVAGSALLRPPWFFDVRQQGEGLADVGTHLVDLVQWTLFPEQAINYQRDIAVLRGAHWPTSITLAQFQRVTGEKSFPSYVETVLRNGSLECFANNTVSYRIRGVHVSLEVKWGLEAPAGGKDTEFAVFRGSRSRIEVRQGPEEQFIPEVYVVPNQPELNTEVAVALQRNLEAMLQSYPGLSVQPQGARLRIAIPVQFRVGHEAHFARLTKQFLEYVRNPKSMPACEKPNMCAKYFVTTQGVKLARESQVR